MPCTAAEKAKSLRLDLANLRESMLAEKGSVWKGIRSTASKLFRGMRDVRPMSSVAGGRKAAAGPRHGAAPSAASRGRAKPVKAASHEDKLRKVAELQRDNEHLRAKLARLSQVTSEEGARELGLTSLKGDGSARGREEDLHQDWISHIVHRTRPGMTGGVVCAPPFCDESSLPSVLPGDSAAVMSRRIWQRQKD